MFSATKAQCFTRYRATPMASRHTLFRFNRLVLHSRSLQARCFAAPRQGPSAGCAYPKSSTMLIARYACHRPSNTRPHRQKAEAKVGRRNRKCLSVHRLTLAILPHIPLGRKGDFLNRSVGRSGGLVRQTQGSASYSVKGCETAFCPFQSLISCPFW